MRRKRVGAEGRARSGRKRGEERRREEWEDRGFYDKRVIIIRLRRG